MKLRYPGIGLLLIIIMCAPLFANGGAESDAFEEMEGDEAFEIGPSAADMFIRGQESWDSHERAYEYYVMATEIDPGYAAAWYQRSHLEIKLFDDRRMAEESLLMAIDVDPGFLTARYKLIDMWRYDKERAVAAAEQVELILEYVPDDPRALFIKGQMLAEQGETREALEYVEMARESALERGDRGFANALLNDLAYLNKDLDRPEVAIEIYREALEKEPENAHSAVELAWLLFQENRVDEAIQVLEQAIEVSWDPNFPREELAHLYLEIGELAPAEQLAQQVLEEDPERYRARSTVAQVQLTREEYDAAAQNFRRVLERKDWNPWLWSQLGYAELGRGDINAAYEAFTIARDQWRDGVAGLLGLAETEELRGNFPGAIRVLEQGIEKSGYNPALRLRLAIVLYKAGDTGGASELAEDLIREDFELNQEELRYYRWYFERNPDSLEVLREFGPELSNF